MKEVQPLVLQTEGCALGLSSRHIFNPCTFIHAPTWAQAACRMLFWTSIKIQMLNSFIVCILWRTRQNLSILFLEYFSSLIRTIWWMQRSLSRGKKMSEYLFVLLLKQQDLFQAAVKSSVLPWSDQRAKLLWPCVEPLQKEQNMCLQNTLAYSQGRLIIFHSPGGLQKLVPRFNQPGKVPQLG